MSIDEAQKDMRQSYLGGGPGVFASGLIWLIAGILALFFTKQTSIQAFFFGGMLIHPLGLMISKLFNRSGEHQKKNPLGNLAMESTAILFIGLFISYSIFQVKPHWFYSIMLMIIGVRYLVFQSMYGMKIFWMIGFFLMTAGVISLISNQPFLNAAIIGGIIELGFSIYIIQVERKLVE